MSPLVVGLAAVGALAIVLVVGFVLWALYAPYDDEDGIE